jgi:mitotic spindle assembly checkpoint protein MAD1
VNAIQAIEVLREENGVLERRAASADGLRETVVRLEAEVEAARAEREAWCVSPSCFPLFLSFCIYGANVIGAFRARNAVPETPAATPVSITQSLSALRVEHGNLLEEHGAGCAVLRQREAELADAQAHKVNTRVTADAHLPHLQATRAAEDRATRAERTAALAEREVGFLNALNVHPPIDCLKSLSSLES